MINQEQVQFYRDNGYLVVENVFNPEEVAAMRQVLEDLVEKARGVEDHTAVYDLEPSHSTDNPRVRRIKSPHEVDPIYRQMAEQPNLISILQKLVSPDLVLHGTKINLKSAGHGAPVEWHQDWAFYPHTNDDVTAIGIMLDDMTPDNGPLLVAPGSHKGPTFDHHVDGYFAGAVDPSALDFDPKDAAMVTGKAGACSFHHVRAMHGSAQNTSGADRRLYLLQVAAADAWDLRGLPDTWEEHESRVIAGKAVLEPRVVPAPIRLPYPPAKHEGSIYENQRVANTYFGYQEDASVNAAE